jgi:phosphocarrier protein HPr
MAEASVRLVNALGLHARAAAQLVRVATPFRCDIIIEREDSGLAANARSILSLLFLAAGCGTTVRIICTGEDADQALRAVCSLVENGFGEL